MPREKIFPMLMVLMAVGAALLYIPTGDWRRVVYWLAAAVITIVIT